MQKLTRFILSMILSTPLAACHTEEIPLPQKALVQQPTDHKADPTPAEEDVKLKITTGSERFTVTLEKNATVEAFKKLLPLTLTLSDLNHNEKHADLPENLPIHSSNPGTIENGDLMIYGTCTLVLFYKSFQTSYHYTRLGKIDHAAGLATALGTGKAMVHFELDTKKK